MKLQLFQIHLDNTHGVYAPGEVVSGRVDVVVEKAADLNSIQLNFKGHAEVHWSEGGGGNSSSTHYKSNEDYFHIVQDLIARGANLKILLSAGHHTFPFSYQLPSTNLPTSFDGDHGFVRYYLEGVIDESPLRFNKRCKVVITIVTPVDCNLYPMLLNPSKVTGTKTICCCCCGGKVDSMFEIQRQSFCPGEYILYNAEVKNGSCRDVQPIIELCTKIYYKTEVKNRVIDKVVAKDRKAVISSKARVSFPPKQMVVPSIAATLTNCNIIEAVYFLRFRINVSMGVDAHLDTPILIGTIPANVATPQFGFEYNTQQYGVVTQQPSAPPDVFRNI